MKGARLLVREKNSQIFFFLPECKIKKEASRVPLKISTKDHLNPAEELKLHTIMFPIGPD